MPNEKSAYIRLDFNCNENCLFCTVAKDNHAPLITLEAKNKIESLASRNVKKIAFTGGEPTLRKDLIELIKFAKENEMKEINIQTNGVKIADEKYLLELKNAGLNSALIGFHSHKNEIYNKLTNSNFYENAISGIQNCINSDITLTICCVINKENYKELIDLVKFIRNLSKKTSFFFCFIRPNGNTLDNPWIVPKLTEIEPFLYKTMNYLKSEDIDFLIEGLPLCYMQGFENYSADLKRKLIEPQEYAGGGESKHKNLHNFIYSNLKNKSEACGSCSSNSLCPGVWKEYSDLYGTSELFPVFNKLQVGNLNG
jgi:MoaA/NifB/PqqE/SkfB family radical SAM enzyme